MHASHLISLLVMFVVMPEKQLLNLYLWSLGGSEIECCSNSQLTWYGLEKWLLNFFIETLPVILQAALLLHSLLPIERVRLGTDSTTVGYMYLVIYVRLPTTSLDLGGVPFPE